MPQFFFYFLRRGDGVCNLFAKKLVITAAHPLHSFFDGFFGHARLTSNFRVRFTFGSFNEQRLQSVEEVVLARRGEFSRKPGQHVIEQGQCPPPLENAFRIPLVRRFMAISVFCFLCVEREKLTIAASFSGSSAVSFIRDKVVEGRQEERTELTFFASRFLNRTTFEQLGEKSLGQILSVMFAMSAAAQIGVKGVPVNPAKLVQSQCRVWKIKVTRGQNHAPMGGGKKPVAARWNLGRHRSQDHRARATWQGRNQAS
ncbi:MAG TPA: hypothetical protein VJ063_21200 [Verrucomicrobiae bacterium]|nr:hypothetical protein [Verrucomicrobiae bacterium]